MDWPDSPDMIKFMCKTFSSVWILKRKILNILFFCALPDAEEAAAAKGPEEEGLSIQKREPEVEGWASSWAGPRGAFVSITGSTERDISDAETGEVLWAGRSVSEDKTMNKKLLTETQNKNIEAITVFYKNS